MKNWISEHVFLVDAVVYFLFTLYLCINYLAGRNSWTDAPFWCFFVIAVYLHVLKRAKKTIYGNKFGVLDYYNSCHGTPFWYVYWVGCSCGTDHN